MAVSQPERVSVVLRSSGGVGEHGVGLGEEGECLRGVGIRAVHVRVVGFGERVEGFLDLAG